MKRARRVFAAAAALLLLFTAFGCAGETPNPSPEEERVTAEIADTNEVLINPGKGFVHYGGEYEETKELSYIYSTGYHRFNWVDLEPSDNEFDFSKIESWIHTFCDKMQRKFAFGVMCVNTSSTKEYITPKFVFDQGAAYDIHTADDGTRQYIPKWDDEVYLAQVDELTAELGRRYNGDLLRDAPKIPCARGKNRSAGYAANTARGSADRASCRDSGE